MKLLHKTRALAAIAARCAAALAAIAARWAAIAARWGCLSNLNFFFFFFFVNSNYIWLKNKIMNEFKI